MSNLSIFCLFFILGAVLILVVMVHRTILRIWIAVELIHNNVREGVEEIRLIRVDIRKAATIRNSDPRL